MYNVDMRLARVTNGICMYQKFNMETDNSNTVILSDNMKGYK